MLNDLNKISTVPEKKPVTKTSEAKQTDQSCTNHKTDKKETDKKETKPTDKQDTKPNDSQKAWSS